MKHPMKVPLTGKTRAVTWSSTRRLTIVATVLFAIALPVLSTVWVGRIHALVAQIIWAHTATIATVVGGIWMMIAISIMFYVPYRASKDCAYWSNQQHHTHQSFQRLGATQGETKRTPNVIVALKIAETAVVIFTLCVHFTPVSRIGYGFYHEYEKLYVLGHMNGAMTLLVLNHLIGAVPCSIAWLHYRAIIGKGSAYTVGTLRQSIRLLGGACVWLILLI